METRNGASRQEGANTRQTGTGAPEVAGEGGIGGEMAEGGLEIGTGPPVGEIAARTTAEISSKEAEVFRGKGGEIMGGRLQEEGTKRLARTTGADRRPGMDGGVRDRRECR